MIKTSVHSGWARAASLVFTFIALVAVGVGSARAQPAAYPSKPVVIISPYAPGGGNDVIARAMAVRLGQKLGQPVIVENKPGANAVIGADYVAKQPADGYTIVLLPTQHVYNSAIYEKMPFDAVKDFTPIAMVGTAPVVVAARAGAPFKNLQELIQYAKQRPANDVTFSTAGAGSTGHLAGALLAQVVGVQFQHIAYKGAAPAAQALLSGEVMLSISPPASLLPHVRAGKMVAIGMTGSKRSMAAPDVPTIREQGLKDYDAGLWYGFFGPANMPREVVAKLNAAINAVLDDKDVKDVLAKAGVDPAGTTSEEFTKMVLADVKRWPPIVKAAGVKLD
jgi:tripartite-type tricarboxylate transporter receptor subunit TctC